MHIINTILNNEFLPVELNAHSNHFSSTDSKRCFEKNLKTQPDDWYYRHNPVTYTLNSNGYRTAEFSTVDWEDSVVVFGCSNAFGTGITDEHTISSQLSMLINRPVINLGVAGSSIQHATYNSTILSAYPCPYAVIQLWTSPERTILFDGNMASCIGPWDHKLNYYNEWLRNNNPSVSALIHRKISQQLWTDRTRYLEGTLFNATAELFKNCPLFNATDFARDQMHPGRHTTKYIAQHFAEQLT